MGESTFPQLGLSGSETQTALKCMRAWWYAHHPAVHIAPKSLGIALTRGLVGHKALELFYSGIQVEKDYDQCAEEALNHVQGEVVKSLMLLDSKKVEALTYLKKLLEMYFEHYRSDIENWEILEVEAFHLLEWDGESAVYLPMRLDLTIYQRAGNFRGETSPVDHKFVNDFWNPWKFRLNAQLPLYIRALRAARFAGKPTPVVRRSVVNQIRTRAVAKPFAADTFRRSFIEADAHAMKLIFENHLKIARRIADLKRLPANEAFDKSEAAWGGPSCDFCHFKSVCATQLEGGNIENTIAAEYKASDYGYPSMEELKRER